jgi:hypothetical protein
MDNNKHMTFKNFYDTRAGLLILILATIILLGVSFSNDFWFRQWLGIGCAIVFYCSATFTAIHRINKRIDKGELSLPAKEK